MKDGCTSSCIRNAFESKKPEEGGKSDTCPSSCARSKRHMGDQVTSKDRKRNPTTGNVRQKETEKSRSRIKFVAVEVEEDDNERGPEERECKRTNFGTDSSPINLDNEGIESDLHDMTNVRMNRDLKASGVDPQLLAKSKKPVIVSPGSFPDVSNSLEIDGIIHVGKFIGSGKDNDVIALDEITATLGGNSSVTEMQVLVLKSLLFAYVFVQLYIVA